MNVTEAQKAMENAKFVAPPKVMTERFKDLWPTLHKPLADALRARTKDHTENLDKMLAELAAREKKGVAEILNELKATLEADLKTPDQMELDLGLDNRDRSVEALKRRISQIPHEIEAEHEQIDRRFALPTPRLFPVAITFLVPESMARKESSH